MHKLPSNGSGAAGWREFVHAICIALALMFVCAGLARAAELPAATDARVAGTAERTRFVADLTRPVSYSIYVLPDPYRVVIDMPGMNFQLPPGAGTKVQGLVARYRFGPLGENRSRFVIDTKGPVLIAKSFIVKPEGGQPARIVADLVATDEATFLKTYRAEARLASAEDAGDAMPDPAAAEEPGEIAPAGGEAPGGEAMLEGGTVPVPRPKPGTEAADLPATASIAPPKDRPVIVIDPGHGGIDPGAVGYNRVREKDVVLAFAAELRRKIEAEGKYKVIMTREGDDFVSLRDRVRVARKNAADLFIAVHADTVRGATARGATVYTVSDKASDAEAEALAQKENRADIIAGMDLGAESEEVTGILIDLAQRETKNHANVFAKRAVKDLKPVTHMTGQPLRSAGFVVLKAPDVPSILIELGYLTSKSDVALLTAPAWRAKVAAALVRSVDAHFAAEMAARR